MEGCYGGTSPQHITSKVSQQVMVAAMVISSDSLQRRPIHLVPARLPDLLRAPAPFLMLRRWLRVESLHQSWVLERVHAPDLEHGTLSSPLARPSRAQPLGLNLGLALPDASCQHCKECRHAHSQVQLAQAATTSCN